MIGQHPQFTVSEFVAIFNQSIEMMYPMVVVSGEIANFRVSKGQWVYFDLKDESSSVKFFGSVHRLPGPLEDGMTCEVWGRPRLHNLYGFSVNFEQVRPVGEGMIRKAQELLRAKLEKEGLFAAVRKRSLPYPPQNIGLITSAESAAISDFRKIIAVRWPSLQIELMDTLVQGNQAVQSIIAGIHYFNELSNPPEVLVIIRGGGSTDDLAVFSDEAVVRAVAGSRVPTLVAIGHENDISLAELAADVRASTPSNAAELLVPDASTELRALHALTLSLDHRLEELFDASFVQLAQYEQFLNERIASMLTRERQVVTHAKELLQLLDPLQPLKKGYALVWDNAGKQVRSVEQLTDDRVFTVELTDGKKQFNIMETE